MIRNPSIGDSRSHDRFCLIAEKFPSDPKRIGVAIANVDRWLAAGHGAKKRLLQWREMLVAAQTSDNGMAALRDLLRDDSEEARFLKGFAPFPGVLRKEEQELIPWTSRH